MTWLAHFSLPVYVPPKCRSAFLRMMLSSSSCIRSVEENVVSIELLGAFHLTATHGERKHTVGSPSVYILPTKQPGWVP